MASSARGPRRARRSFGHAEVFAAIFALSFLVARFLPLLELGWACPWKALTGIPCPTCGMTHAFVHLAHGDVAAALSASPAGALLAVAVWLFAALDGVRLALGLALRAPSPRAGQRLAAASVIALLANWAFLVVAHRG
jgi:hypothetical protein